jgi:hypothetical protein
MAHSRTTALQQHLQIMTARSSTALRSPATKLAAPQRCTAQQEEGHGLHAQPGPAPPARGIVSTCKGMQQVTALLSTAQAALHFETTPNTCRISRILPAHPAMSTRYKYEYACNAQLGPLPALGLQLWACSSGPLPCKRSRVTVDCTALPLYQKRREQDHLTKTTSHSSTLQNLACTPQAPPKRGCARQPPP